MCRRSAGGIEISIKVRRITHAVSLVLWTYYSKMAAKVLDFLVNLCENTKTAPLIREWTKLPF